MEKSSFGEIDWDSAHEAGMEVAFEDLIQAYQADVTQLAYRLLGWSGDVEDVVQEVFLAAYMNRFRFRGDCSPKTWLFTITINACRSFQRRQGLRWRLFAWLKAENASQTERPSESSGERMEMMRRALLRLSPKYREPVILRYLEEMSIDQISTVLKISANAVHVRLNRARMRLREELRDE